MAAVALAAMVGLRGQITNQGVFRSGPLPIIGDCVKWSGPNSITDSGSPCASGPPPTACTDGSFDLSLTTGCNIPFYVGGIFP